MVSKIIVILFTIGCLSALVFASGEDSMSTVVNRLMLEGKTAEQIEVIKAYPVWPSYDENTGMLLNGPHRFISPDLRTFILYHVQTFKDGQRIEKEVINDYSKK